MSTISEVNNFLSRKPWITTKRSVVNAKVRNSVPVKWVFKSKEEDEGFISLNSINIVQGYMKVPGVDFTKSFSLVTSDTLTRILRGMTFYNEEYGWIAYLCDMES